MISLNMLVSVVKASFVMGCRLQITAQSLCQYGVIPKDILMKLIVIGAGPGGYAAAFAAAKHMEVVLVERDQLGGTCLHRGCIPTKTLRASADALVMAGRFKEFGLSGGAAPVADMPAIVARKDKITATLAGGLEKTASSLGVRVLKGQATLTGPSSVRVVTAEGQEVLMADAIVLATGSSPLELPGLPVDHKTVITSDDALNLQSVPDSMLIVGGGVIGCELACIFRAFGSRVTVVEGQDRLLPMPSVDEDISRLLLREMKKKGIAVELGKTVSEVVPQEQGVMVRIGGSPFVTCATPPEPKTVQASCMCVTVGRTANSFGLGLENVGIRTDARGWIEVNAALETSVSGIYAIGDALGPKHIMLAHMATAEAHTVVHNLLHPEDKHTQRYDIVPSAVFTEPEIGEVGLTEAQAREHGFNVRATTLQLRELGKAQAMGALAGLIKLIADADTGKLLGAHIAGAHASDLIAEAVLALQKGCTVAELAETIHAHPTLAEGIYEAAQR